jgi:hypothetical protein
MYYRQSAINAERPVFERIVMRRGRTLENRNVVEA